MFDPWARYIIEIWDNTQNKFVPSKLFISILPWTDALDAVRVLNEIGTEIYRKARVL